MVMSYLSGRGPLVCGPAADLSALAEVRAYWQALRQGDALPRRDRIDPRGLSGALDRVFLADRIAPGQARLRIAGMRLADLMGMEARGMPLSALFLSPARPRLEAAVEAVAAGRALVELAVETERRLGLGAQAGRLLMLPVARADGSPGLVLGCLALPPAPGWRSPGRLTIRHLQEVGIGGGPSPQPEADWPETAAREAALPGLGPAGPSATGPALPARGHLRLVHSAG